MRINISLAHDQHSKVPLVDEGMTLTMAVTKEGVPFKQPPAPMVPKPPPPPSTPPWKPPPPSKDGSNPQPKGSSGS